MYKGDISNTVSRRLIVTYEALTKEVEEPRKILGLAAGTKTYRRFRRDILNQLWRYTDRFPVQVEMVNYGVDDDEAEARLDALDKFGTNPVNYSVAYADIDEFLDELPYRIDIIGVMDIPENQLRYGSIGIGLDHIGRTL